MSSFFKKAPMYGNKPMAAPSNLQKARQCAAAEKKWKELKEVFLAAAMEDSAHPSNQPGTPAGGPVLGRQPATPHIGNTVPVLPQSALGTSEPDVQIGQEPLSGNDDPAALDAIPTPSRPVVPSSARVTPPLSEIPDDDGSSATVPSPNIGENDVPATTDDVSSDTPPVGLKISDDLLEGLDACGRLASDIRAGRYTVRKSSGKSRGKRKD